MTSKVHPLAFGSEDGEYVVVRTDAGEVETFVKVETMALFMVGTGNVGSALELVRGSIQAKENLLADLNAGRI